MGFYHSAIFSNAGGRSELLSGEPEPLPVLLIQGKPLSLPTQHPYAASRMAALVFLIARRGLVFSSYEDLKRQLDAGVLPPGASILQGAHPSNLRFWLEELRRCELVQLRRFLIVQYAAPHKSRLSPGGQIRAVLIRCIEEISAAWPELASLLEERGRA